MHSFKLKNGRVVLLEWDDECVMTVWTDHTPPQEVGAIEFFRSEGPEDWDNDSYLVTGMSLEGAGPDYLNKGIGREVLRYLVQEEGLKIYFSPNDGHRRDDGSHLTGAGLPFAQQMVAEGLAEWAGSNAYYDRNDVEFDVDSD